MYSYSLSHMVGGYPSMLWVKCREESTALDCGGKRERSQRAAVQRWEETEQTVIYRSASDHELMMEKTN